MKTFKNEKFNELMKNGLELAPKMLAKHKENCEAKGREYGVSIEFKKWNSILNANLDNVTDEEIESFMFDIDSCFTMKEFVPTHNEGHDPRNGIKYINHKAIEALNSGRWK